LVIRHRNSWQDAARIFRDFGELQKFVLTVGQEMNINFETPPARRLLYQGGTLIHGQVIDYKKNLLASGNIESFRHETSGSSRDVVRQTSGHFGPATDQSNDSGRALFLSKLQSANDDPK
jgi:hypothetical protein